MGWNTPEDHQESVASQDDLNHGLQNAFVDMVKNGTMHEVQKALAVFQLPPAGQRDHVLETLSVVLNRYFNAIDASYDTAIEKIVKQYLPEPKEGEEAEPLKIQGVKDREDIRRLVMTDLLTILDENVVWGKAASELKEGEVAMKPSPEMAAALGIAHKMVAEQVEQNKQQQMEASGPQLGALPNNTEDQDGFFQNLKKKMTGAK